MELECVATLLLALLTVFGTFFFITSAVGRFCEKCFGTPFFLLDPFSWDFGSVVNLAYLFFPFYSCNLRFVFIIYYHRVFLVENPTMLSTCYVSTMPIGMPVHFYQIK